MCVYVCVCVCVCGESPSECLNLCVIGRVECQRGCRACLGGLEVSGVYQVIGTHSTHSLLLSRQCFTEEQGQTLMEQNKFGEKKTFTHEVKHAKVMRVETPEPLIDHWLCCSWGIVTHNTEGFLWHCRLWYNHNQSVKVWDFNYIMLLCRLQIQMFLLSCYFLLTNWKMAGNKGVCVI